MPCAIQIEASLAAAASCLSQFNVSCVPVFDGDALCGVLFARDVDFARALGLSLGDLKVRHTPLQDAYVASSDMSLLRVARAMVRHRVSAAVVQDGREALGLLFLHDVTSALVDAVARSAIDDPVLPPSEVRGVILAEHASIRRLLLHVEEAARRIRMAERPVRADLDDAHESARALCAVMKRHLELENRLLAPALEALDAWGNVRAERLRREHAEQAVMLRSYMQALEQTSTTEGDGPRLAALAEQLVAALRKDMQEEEESLLRPDLLCDDPTGVVVEAG